MDHSIIGSFEKNAAAKGASSLKPVKTNVDLLKKGGE